MISLLLSQVNISDFKENDTFRIIKVKIALDIIGKIIIEWAEIIFTCS